MTSTEPIHPRFIGDPRLARLLEACGGDRDLAHRLFVWNVRASGAAMESIHLFELLLRNALDRELRVWNQAMSGTPEWLLRPHPFLTKSLNPGEVQKSRARALRVAAEQGRAMSHDDVLAQMSLGTWRYLLPSRSVRAKQKLWETALVRAFPVWPGAWGPESIVSRVTNAHELRNRVAHLEPLHRYDLRRVRRDMRSVCHAIGPDAARFFVQNERLLPIVETNPLLGEADGTSVTPTRWSPAAST